jgi:flagella basal body P-ring formation protein FlgA
MFFAPFAIAACLTLPNGAANVTAADLRLEGVPPETVLSFAPSPGVDRVFHFSELRQIAARFHLENVPEDDICVSRAMALLDPATLLAAMHKNFPEAAIEISEFSKQLAPRGEIEFRRAGLRNNTVSGATWFGTIHYAPNRDFTIWAKVTLTTRVTRVIAGSDLAPGKPIEATQIQLETVDEFPSTQPLEDNLADALGRYPRTTIRAGAPIRRDALEAATDVRLGEIVEVDVLSGKAHLKFEARAEASGKIGQTVAVRNPTSTKRFQAKIEAKGKVSVDANKIP